MPRKGKKNEEIKLKCPFIGCNNIYLLRNKLLAHLRTHYGIKPYGCHFCGKNFNDKGNLKTHLRIHTGERPYKCGMCEKGFKTEGQLKEHLGSHYKKKPFQCPYCFNYYKRKGVVKKHMFIHRKDPNFLKNEQMYFNLVNNIEYKNTSIIQDNNTSLISKGETFSFKNVSTQKENIFLGEDNDVSQDIFIISKNVKNEVCTTPKIIEEEDVKNKLDISSQNSSRELYDMLQNKISEETYDKNLEHESNIEYNRGFKVFNITEENNDFSLNNHLISQENDFIIPIDEDSFYQPIKLWKNIF